MSKVQAQLVSCPKPTDVENVTKHEWSCGESCGEGADKLRTPDGRRHNHAAAVERPKSQRSFLTTRERCDAPRRRCRGADTDNVGADIGMGITAGDQLPTEVMAR
ncbi:unnamed protein product [Lampetra fluviatilis]